MIIIVIYIWSSWVDKLWLYGNLWLVCNEVSNVLFLDWGKYNLICSDLVLVSLFWFRNFLEICIIVEILVILFLSYLLYFIDMVIKVVKSV